MSTTPTRPPPNPGVPSKKDAPRPQPRPPRGTTNRNQRGGTETRRRRREYLVETYRANVDVGWSLIAELNDRFTGVPLGEGVPACRCFRCGVLLTVDSVTVDRIIPGCKGGTYKRNNIRPACGPCNSETGGSTRSTS